MINIDKGVPVPVVCGRAGSGAKAIYPYEKMGVGDSFFAGCKHNPISIAKRWGKSRGVDFCSRKVDGGWRIWRTK